MHTSVCTWNKTNTFQGLFVIGARYKKESTDVVKAVQKIPLIQYPDWNSFCAAAPHDAKWVAVEMGICPLC